MSDSATNIGNTLGTAWHVASAKFITQIGYISGSGSPVGSQTPAFIGQEYFDTSGNNWWKSYGTANTQWVQTGGQTETEGPTTITATSATALVVGQNGATHPALTINTNTASSVTGLSITSAASGAGVAEAVTSSATNENWTLDAKGSGTITLNGTGTGAVNAGGGGGGLTVVAGGLTVTAGGATITAGGLTVTAGGATVTAGGLTVTAGGLTVTAGGLTVSAGNTSLPAGTATVAPLTLTAGTNLTAAAAGAVEFDGNAFYATAVASSRQQIDAEQFIIATANSATYNNAGLDSNSASQVFTSTTNTALSAGAVTVQNGKTYAFEFQYMLTNTGTTSHTWAVALGGNATFAAGSGYSATGVTGTTASTPASGSLTGFINSTTLSTAVVVTAASTSATEQVTVSGSGVLVIGSSGGGTIIPQMKASARPGASGTPGVTILAGSFFRIWEMGTNTQVGDWS